MFLEMATHVRLVLSRVSGGGFLLCVPAVLSLQLFWLSLCVISINGLSNLS